jgi:hypothetical protein
MGLTRAHAVHAIRNAEVVYPSQGRRVYAAGDLMVVVAGESGIIVTVLPRTPESYDRSTLVFPLVRHGVCAAA